LLNGSIDEFRIYSSAMSPSQVAASFANGPDAAITSGAPAFVVDVQDQAVPEAAAATLAPIVNGTAPIRYQWFRNGAAVAGATNGSFSIPSASLNDSGTILRCRTGTSSATSRVATLTVVGQITSLRNRYAFDTDARDSWATRTEF
jgi:hypothetical protein